MAAFGPAGSLAGNARRRLWPAVFALLAATLAASTARADNCFTENMTEQETIDKLQSGGESPVQYLLGIDRLLDRVDVRFFPDGRVCGSGWLFRFQGSNVADGEIRLTFLAAPPADLGREERYRIALFGSKLSGSARKQITEELIIWEGRLKSADGKQHDFYLKRTRSTAKKRPLSNTPCGMDGGCIPLTVMITFKKGSETQLRQDARSMPITKIAPAEFCESDAPKKDEVCFEAKTWPHEEDNVVIALRRKPYVRDAKRPGVGAGGDTEVLVLESTMLLSSNLRLNVPIAVATFQEAIARYFEGTGLSVADPAVRQNSLIWEFKGQRFQFERKSNPSPADKSEWWKIRLQIAVTVTGPESYVLLIGMPETRITSWGLGSVPNDEKFTTELTNDTRFLDLQGRLIVSITKRIAATKDGL